MKIDRGNLIAALLCFCVLNGFGCSEQFRESMGSLWKLRVDISKAIGHANVNVTLQNNNCIGISLINSPFNDADADTQNELGEILCSMIEDHFGENDGIKYAWVSFVKHKKFGIAQYTNALNTKFYERSDDGTWRRKGFNQARPVQASSEES